MSRRRAAREQEKQEFLQQNPELITFDTRLEVEALSVEPDNQDDVEEGQLFGVSVDSDLTPATMAEITSPFHAGDFTLVDAVLLPPVFGIQALQNFFPSTFMDGAPTPPPEALPEPATISLSAAGFGVTNEDELGSEPPEDDIIPPGVDTLGAGEALIFQTGNGKTLGIDFTASGQGNVVFMFIDGKGGAPVTEEFQIPRGTSPDDVLTFDVDTSGSFVFGAALYTTGSAEISIIGVDLTTSGDDVFAAA